VQACGTLLCTLARTHGVGEPRGLVDHDVVRATEVSVPRILGEGDGWCRHVAQAMQVEYLQSMALRLGDNQRVVAKRLDVAPRRVDAVCRQVADAQRVVRI